MSLLTTSNLKNIVNNGKNRATPNDYVFLKEIRVFCPLCKGKHGPCKTFKNLWALKRHFDIYHAQDLEQKSELIKCEKIIEYLYFLISEGVLP